MKYIIIALPLLLSMCGESHKDLQRIENKLDSAIERHNQYEQQASKLDSSIKVNDSVLRSQDSVIRKQHSTQP